MRIYIGTEPKTEIARKVLQLSISRNTKTAVTFVPMVGPEWEYDTSRIRVGTGFSLRRWMIPEKQNWTGRAIYLDADQLVFGDIEELWTMPDKLPSKGCAAWLTYQPSKFGQNSAHTSVMVIDCAAAKTQQYFSLAKAMTYLETHTRQEDYGKLMFPKWLVPPAVKIGKEWNSLNVYAKGKTKLLHYTKEPEQPWYKPDHPLAGLWRDELKIALDLGVVTPTEIREAVSQFGVKVDWRSTNGLHPAYLSLIS